MTERPDFAAVLAATGAQWWLVREAAASTALDRDETHSLQEEGRHEMTSHDPNLIADLACVYAVAWECHDLGEGVTFDPEPDDNDLAALSAVLDRLTELGWRPSEDPPTTCDRCGRHLPCRHCPPAEDIEAKIEASSLGTPEAKRLRASADPALVAGVMRRYRQLAETGTRKERAVTRPEFGEEPEYLDVDVHVPDLTEEDIDRAAVTFYDAWVDGFFGRTLSTGMVWFCIRPGDGEAALAVLAALKSLYGDRVANERQR